ncbi:MAG TPA: hypothetical protein VGK59_10915 [Ohtaekwangia sp.]
MKAPVKIITLSGTEVALEEWQDLYGGGQLKGTDKFGLYFSATEQRFAKDIQEYGQLIVNEALIRVLDHFRHTLKLPVTINSFNRDENKQKSLAEAGYRTATHSPHVVKMAADIDTSSPEETRSRVRILQRCAQELGFKVRIGYEQYLTEGSTFIHVDVCPEFYAPGKPFHNKPHPAVWEKQTVW